MLKDILLLSFEQGKEVLQTDFTPAPIQPHQRASKKLFVMFYPIYNAKRMAFLPQKQTMDCNSLEK